MDRLENLKQGDYQVEISKFVNDGWELLRQNFGGFLGYSFIALLLLGAAGEIPVIGFAANFFGQVLFAGFYIVAHRVWYSKEHRFEDFFDGFRNKWMWQLVLVSLVSTLLVLLCFLPALFGLVPYFLNIFYTGDEAGVPMLSIILLVIGCIPAIYLGLCWMWAPFFVIFKGMDFWPAMETSRQIISKQWGSFFGLGVVLFLINLGGLLALVVGVFVTIPLSYLIVYASFERIVGTAKEEEISTEDEIIQHLVD